MKILSAFFMLFFSLFCHAQSRSEYNWVQLFNGIDLKDWKVKITGYALNDNFGNTFRVKDKKMKVSYDQYKNFDEKFGHIFFKNKYSYYLIAVEYRFIGNQILGGPDWAFKNSGIMVHCQAPESMLKSQDFPISIEVQLLGGKPDGQRPTANVCTPGTNIVMNGKLITDHCLESKSPTFRGEEWVRVEVLVLGDSLIKHIVNGDTVLTYEKPQIGGGNVSNYDPAVKKDGQLLKEGYISLQSESHPIEFRKVELLNLEGCTDPKATNYKSYYLKSTNKLCKYKKGKKASSI